MAPERVLAVRHWTDTQFTFATTRDQACVSRTGSSSCSGSNRRQPLMRAYSIASANHEEHLEFLSIKVAGRPADLAPAAHHARAMKCW